MNKPNQAALVAALNRPVNAYLVARTNAEVWRNKMDAWDRAELDRFEYLTAARWVERGRPSRITDPRHAYLMEDGEYAEFAKERQHYVDSLKVQGLEDGHCPALVAENVQRLAERTLVEAAMPFFGAHMAPDRILCTARGLDTYKEYIGLLVGLTVNSPGYVAVAP